MNNTNHNADDAHLKYRDELTRNNKVQLAENGAHMVNTEMLKELHWLHGIEEYMQYTNDHNLEKYSWQKPHQSNQTGTKNAYHPNRDNDKIKKKYTSWKN